MPRLRDDIIPEQVMFISVQIQETLAIPIKSRQKIVCLYNASIYRICPNRGRASISFPGVLTRPLFEPGFY